MKRLAFHSDQSVHTTHFQSLWKLFLLAGLLVVIDSTSVESFAKDKSAKMKDELQQVLAEEEEEEEEDAEVFEITIDSKAYYTTNETNGKIYAVDKDEEVGDEIGVFVNSKPKFYIVAPLKKT